MGRSRQAGRATRKRRHKQDGLPQAGMMMRFAAASMLPRCSFGLRCPLYFYPVALCHQPQQVRLMKFLHGRGFTSRLLQPAHFPGTAPVDQLEHLPCQSKISYLPFSWANCLTESNLFVLVGPCHPDTGRGLQALRTVKVLWWIEETINFYWILMHFSWPVFNLVSVLCQPGELLISLSESCLLTTSTVLDSYLGHYIKRQAHNESLLQQHVTWRNGILTFQFYFQV